MSMDELSDIFDTYALLSERRDKYFDAMVKYLTQLKDNGYPTLRDIIKSGNYVSFTFMGRNIRIQHEISMTKDFSRVKWLNVEIDCNDRIETTCILTYRIDQNGQIIDGENQYNLSIKVNKYLIDGLVKFFKEIETKQE